MVNSNAKGKRGERELSAWLREKGIEARRGVQYSGGDDSPDIVHSIPNLHIECKRVETLSLYPAMKQACEDAGELIPSVWHRRNNKEWLVVLRAEDFVELIKGEQA